MKKKEEKLHYSASDGETQPRPSQTKVVVNIELGTKRELGLQKKVWAFGFFFFHVQTMHHGPGKDLFLVACCLKCSLLLLNDLCLLLSNPVVLGHAGLDRALSVPLILAVPDAAVHGCPRWWHVEVPLWQTGGGSYRTDSREEHHKES